MFVALKLARDINVSVLGMNQSVPLSFAKGMTGALPVFATREEALDYANGDCEVLKLEESKTND
jgi:hypothetical protein